MEETLNNIRTRPRFKLISDLSKKEFAQNMKEFLDKNAHEFEANINEEVSTIWVKTKDDYFWKPRLSLRTETNDENETEVQGIFGPSSAVWTFFMFLYFGFSILWMVFISFWFVEKQIKTNNYPWALPLSFVTLALLLLTYIATKIGQHKAKSEMEKLRSFAEKTAYTMEKN